MPFQNGIKKLTSTGATVTITDPTGPVSDLETSGGGGGVASLGGTGLTQSPGDLYQSGGFEVQDGSGGSGFTVVTANGVIIEDTGTAGTNILEDGPGLLLLQAQGGGGITLNSTSLVPVTIGVNGTVTNLFVLANDPNGIVTSLQSGDLCIDIGTPAIWQATATASDSSWVQLGAPTSQIAQTVGSWFPINVNPGSLSGGVVGTLYARPFIVTNAHTFVALAWWATAAGTTQVNRYGIFADNGGTPVGGARILDAGTVAVAIGANSIAINQLLAPGLYWLVAVISSQVAPATMISDGGAAFEPTTQFMGQDAPGPISAFNYNGYVSTATTYTGVLPATFPAGSLVSGTSIPAISIQA